MNALDNIMTRRTAHLFTSDPVAPEVLERALEAAIRAPNHKLTNPWRFTELGQGARGAIVDIIIDLKGQKRPLDAAARARVRAKAGGSPICLAVSQVLDSDPKRRKEDYAAVACAIQNLSLALWAQGVASKWSTTGAIADPRTYDVLEIDPECEEIIGLVFVGYRADSPDPPRRPLSEVYRKLP